MYWQIQANLAISKVFPDNSSISQFVVQHQNERVPYSSWSLLLVPPAPAFAPAPFQITIPAHSFGHLEVSWVFWAIAGRWDGATYGIISLQICSLNFGGQVICLENGSIITSLIWLNNHHQGTESHPAINIDLIILDLKNQDTKLPLSEHSYIFSIIASCKSKFQFISFILFRSIHP